MIRRRGHIDRASKAFALLAVMWVVVIAGLILLGLQKAVRVNLAAAHSELASVQAHWLARAGIEQALAVLQNDAVFSDDTMEQWYSSSVFQQVELGAGQFSVIAGADPAVDSTRPRFGLIDHSGRVNVNVADAAQLSKLGDLADWQVDSIIDWRDSDENMRDAGAEAQFYHQLRFPYEIRNGPLQTIGELRLIRGIDETAFTGEDRNNNGVLDVNEDDMQATPPDDNGDGMLTRGLAGLTTVYSYHRNLDAYGEKRVNVNTADKKKLMDSFNFTDALAGAVVNHRSSNNSNSNRPGRPNSSASGNSQRFSSLMKLLDVRVSGGNRQANSSDGKDKVNTITIKWLANHLDELTLTDDERLPGRININTASLEVLLTLPQMNERTVRNIVSRQSAGAGPFRSVGELLTDKILTEEQFKAIAEKVTVRSSVFEVHSLAVTKWGIRQEIVAVIDRHSSPMKILYWYQNE